MCTATAAHSQFHQYNAVAVLAGFAGSKLVGSKEAAGSVGEPQPLGGYLLQEEASDPEAILEAIAVAQYPLPSRVAVASATEVAYEEDCPARRMTDVSLWLPMNPTFLGNRDCFFSMMKLTYDRQSGR